MPYSLYFSACKLLSDILAKGIKHKSYQTVHALLEIYPEVLWQKSAPDLGIEMHFQ